MARSYTGVSPTIKVLVLALGWESGETDSVIYLVDFLSSAFVVMIMTSVARMNEIQI